MTTKTIKTIDNGQIGKLLWALAPGGLEGRSYMLSLRNYCMTVFMLDAGLRVGEMVHLRQSDIVYAGCIVTHLTIRGAISKTRTERGIPMTPRLTLACSDMIHRVWPKTTDREEHYAFYDRDPHIHITVRQVERIIKEAGIAIGLLSITPHILRHTFATRVMKKSNMRVTQQLLGHKSIASTQIYTHPDQDDRTEAIKAISEGDENAS